MNPAPFIGEDQKKGFIFLKWSKDETPRPADCREILDKGARVLATFCRLGTGSREILCSKAISMLLTLLTIACSR